MFSIAVMPLDVFFSSVSVVIAMFIISHFVKPSMDTMIFSSGEFCTRRYFRYFRIKAKIIHLSSEDRQSTPYHRAI